MSKSATRVLLAATAFLLGSTALYAADMPVKAVPLPLQFSWAGAYIGVNAGAVLDRNDPGQLGLTSPGFVFIDPTGAFGGFPTVLRIPWRVLVRPGQSIPLGRIVHWRRTDRLQFPVRQHRVRRRSRLSGDAQPRHPQRPCSNSRRGCFRPAASHATRSPPLHRSPMAGAFRGRFGYAWDRLMVYATGGLAVTSIKTGTHYTYQTILGPYLLHLSGCRSRPAAEPQRARRRLKPRILRRDLWRRLRVCAVGQLEPRRRISRHRFRQEEHHHRRRAARGHPSPQRHAGRNDDAAPLASGHGAAELSLRRHRNGDQVGRAAGVGGKQLERLLRRRLRGRGVGPRPWSTPSIPRPPCRRCCRRRWSRPRSTARAPAPLALLAPFSYNLGASGMGGGTLGCNWQLTSSQFVFGIEAEAGVLRLSATVTDAYNLAFGFTYTPDSTTVGNWYGGGHRPPRLRGRRRAVLSEGRHRLHPCAGRIDRSLRHPGATAAVRR